MTGGSERTRGQTAEDRATGLSERNEDSSGLRQLRDCTIRIGSEFQGKRREGTDSSLTVLDKRRVDIIHSQNINCTIEEEERNPGRRRESSTPEIQC
jgi:hypothetical protein